ncbi:hypothetical protein TNCT_162501 [Trichonephila clavata]|uniref:Uncharacterized protein n=1 Tax=Trichonephila clavata TaxID=2740835 RepID=A0A8X6HXU3_TRICU|nr:hypothetical protein TNCT_162501 [Trichonephila clavata]
MEVTTHTHSRGDAFSQSLQTKSVSTSRQRRKRGLGIKNGQHSDDIGDKRHPREEAPPSHHQFHSKNRKRQQKTGDPEGIARTRYPPKLNKTKIPTIHLFFKESASAVGAGTRGWDCKINGLSQPLRSPTVYHYYGCLRDNK